MINPIKIKPYAILTTLALAIPVVTYFGGFIPQLATAADLSLVKREVLMLGIDVNVRELHRKRYERRQLAEEIQLVITQDKPLTDRLLLDEVELDRDIERIKEFIENAKYRLLHE